MLLWATVAKATAQRPNILFIMTDQMFADAMSWRMGKQYIHTPALDELAKTGVSFTRAYSSNPLCMPSRNTIFTGRYSHETEVTFNRFGFMGIDTNKFVDMGTYFRRAGYQTAYFGKRHLCFKVENGFDVTDEPPAKNHDVATVRSGVEYLSRNHDKPFLLVVSLMNPHNVCELSVKGQLPDGPIGAPPPIDQCPPVPGNLAPQQDEPDTITMIRKGYHATRRYAVGHYTADDWRKLRWGYYRLIEKVDTQIGEVLAALRKAGLQENTLIVFTSDHGECAGAHGFNQKTVFYEESTRVPLILRLPGKTTQGTCNKLVNSGVDMLPTLLDFADIDIPSKLPGLSLRPLATGDSASGWRDYIVIQNNMARAGKVGDIVPTAQGRMVRSQRYAYCVYERGDCRESLVDLENDPGETKNLASDPAYRNELIEHRKMLLKFAMEHNDTLVAGLLADDVKPLPFVSGTR
jgi:choline-sulfatase